MSGRARGWREEADATLAVSPRLIHRFICIVVQFGKIVVGPFVQSDADRNTELDACQRHFMFGEAIENLPRNRLGAVQVAIREQR